MAKTQKWTASTFVSLVHENLTDKGHKVKKSDLNWAVKDAFEAAVAAAIPAVRDGYEVQISVPGRRIEP